MNHSLHREQLGEGIFFSSIQDEKFKHNCITINLITPLEEETAACNAIIPFLLRKGSKNCPDFTLLEQTLCRLYGASLSADIAKVGEYQILSCSLVSIDDRYTLEGETISGECAKLLGDIVLNPNITDGAFPAADFELERQFLVDTIEADINDKRTYALGQCKKEMCKGQRLAVPKYGTVEKARELTPAMAAAQYRRLVDTARVEILFTGCGSPQSAREEFVRLFEKQPRHPLAFVPSPVVERAETPREKTVEMEIAQCKLVMGMRTGRLENKSQVDATLLMTYLYGGTPFSRLFMNVREKHSLCYYCAARFDQNTGILMVDIGVEKENKEKAQAAILEQLAAVAAGEFDDEELEATKLACINSLKSITDSLSALESWYLSQILRGTQVTPQEQVEATRKVTREDVIAAAGKVTLDTVYFLTGKEDKAHE